MVSANVQLDPVEASVLLTVIYRDLFDSAVTLDEVTEYLIGSRADTAQVAAALERLAGWQLARVGDCVTLPGREHLASLRRRRARVSRALWGQACRYAHWLRWTPYLRAVAVSGSLSVNNADLGSDLDFFCITEAGRLWVARLWMSFWVRLSRLGGSAPLEINTIYSEAALEAEERSLYIAHQIAQLVPLWGGESFGRFIAANRWIERYLPQVRVSQRPPLMAPPRPALLAWGERLGRRSVGDHLNAGLRWGYQQWATCRWRPPALRFTREQARRTRQPERFCVAVGHARQVHARFQAACNRWLRPYVPAALWEQTFAPLVTSPTVQAVGSLPYAAALCH